MTAPACPECGRLCVDARGLGGHRRAAHGVQGSSTTAAAWRSGRRWTATKKDTRSALQRLLPDADGLVLQRLAKYIVDLDNPRALVIIGTHYGPHLVSRQHVGDLVRRAKEPCIVVELDQLAAHCARLAAS